MHVSTYVYIHIYISIPIYLSICLYIYECGCTYVFACEYASIFAGVYVHAQKSACTLQLYALLQDGDLWTRIHDWSIQHSSIKTDPSPRPEPRPSRV